MTNLLKVLSTLTLVFALNAHGADEAAAPTETGRAPTADTAGPAKAEATEPAAQALEQSGPPFQEEAIEWDAESARKVHFPEKGEPNLILSGKIAEKHTLFFNDTPVEITDGRFTIPVKLTDSVNEYTIKLGIPDVGENVYKFTYAWKKLPPEKQFKVKIREGGKVVEKATAAVTKVQSVDDWIEQGPTQTRRSGRAFLRQFEGQGMLILDSLGGLVATLGAGWSPEYRINRRWTLGGGLGIMLYKNQQQEYFPAFEYRVSIARKFGRVLEVEFLTGAQSWLNVQGFIPMFGINFMVPRSWLIGDSVPFFKLGRKLFIGYTFIAHSSEAHLIRLGGRLAF